VHRADDEMGLLTLHGVQRALPGINAIQVLDGGDTEKFADDMSLRYGRFDQQNDQLPEISGFHEITHWVTRFRSRRYGRRR
jgi:hypothetical protein